MENKGDQTQHTAADEAAQKARSNSGQKFGNLDTLKRDGDRGSAARSSLTDQSAPKGMFANAFHNLVKPESK